jgi:hypothetical protein
MHAVTTSQRAQYLHCRATLNHDRWQFANRRRRALDILCSDLLELSIQSLGDLVIFQIFKCLNPLLAIQEYTVILDH